MATQVVSFNFNAEAKHGAAFDVTASAGLFVGISIFEDEWIATVPFAADDAVDLAHLFTVELGLILPERTVLLLSGEPWKDESKERLEELKRNGARCQTARIRDVYKYVGEQARRTKPHGLFVLTLATHGVSDQGEDFLVATDSLTERTIRTGVQVAALFDEVSRAGAGRRLVFLDACREQLSKGTRGEVGSAMTPSFAKAIARAKGSAVLSAAPLGGFAYDDPVRRNGVFTAAVLDGLRGQANANADGWITVRTLADFVQEQVAEWVRIHRPDHAEKPLGIERRIEATAGDLPLARHPSEGARSKEPEESRPELSPRWWDRRWARTILLIAMLAAMGGGLWRTLDARAPAVTSERGPIFSADILRRSKVPLPRPSVAVMTFENRSGERDLDWLSTALAEAVSAKLGIAGDVRAVDRHEVVLVETDLLLTPRAKDSPRDLARMRGLLGVDFILRGVYDRDGENSLIRLFLTLYDSRDGRVVAQTRGEGTVSTWIDLADRSTGDLTSHSLRQVFRRPPLTPSQEASLRALFPVGLTPAKLYIQGLERYRHFDVVGASDLFGRSVGLEAHPVVLAALADTCSSLGDAQKGREAIQTAKRLEEQIRNTPRALPERYQREIEIIQRKVDSDKEEVASGTESFFRDFFADDLSYGLLAVKAFIDAGSPDLAEPLLKELRLLPLAGSHPNLDRLEADALFVQQRYGSARNFASRAIVKAQSLRAIRQEALARLQLASLQSFMGEGVEAEKQFRLAKAGFEQTGDRMGIAHCLENSALFYVSFDLSLAQELYRQAIGYYEALGNQREQARALFGLSAVLTEAGRLPEAKEISRKAADLASHPEDGLEPFIAGYHAFLAGQLTRAQGQYETAKAIFERNKQRDDYAVTLTNLGEVELMRGKLANAQDLHRKALVIHEEVQSEAVPFDMVCLGRVQAVAGEFAAARTWYEQALRTLGIEGGVPKEPTAWAEALLALAELDLLSGRAEKSEERARDLIERAAVELDAVRSRALSLLACTLLDQGRTQTAWEAVSEALELAPGDFRAVRESGIAAARVRAARGEVDPALKELDRIAAEAAKWGQVVYELESVLAAGEIELRDGRLTKGRRRLETLRVRAAALGFGQIIKRVASALEE